MDLAAAPASTPATPVVDEDRIRALLLSQTDFEKLKKIFDEIPDRALKLKLLDEKQFDAWIKPEAMTKPGL